MLKAKKPNISVPVIMALCASVAVLVTIGAGFFIAALRRDTIQHAQIALKNQAYLLVEQTNRALEATQLVEKDIVDRIRLNHAATGQDFEQFARSPRMAEILREKTDELPHVVGIAIIRKDGLVLAAPDPAVSLQQPNVRDRGYFKAVLSHPLLETRISKATRSVVSGVPRIFVSRKITANDGELLGVINAAIDITFFENLYLALTDTKTSSHSLYRRDGFVLASTERNGAGPGLEGQQAPDIARVLAEAEKGLIRNQHGDDTLAAFKASASFPIGISVSETYSTILARWRVEAFTIGGIAALMNLAILIICFLGMQQVKTSALRVAGESYLARHDIMTKAPNRLFFIEEMKRSFLEAQETGAQFALMVLDINRFKEINDSLGHPVGDIMIRNVAGRLAESVRANDFVARIGGDEFAIVLRSIKSEDDVSQFASRLKAILAEPYVVGERTIYAHCSYGVAIGPSHGMTATELLKAADLALYAAKERDETDFRVYDRDLNEQHLTQKQLEADLTEAVKRNEFELHYQPITSLRTGKPWGFEALVRWRRPGHGLVPPGEFIPTLESMGLITPMGQWVLKEACRQAVKWPLPINVAVNVSPIQLQRSDILECVQIALDESGLPAQRLTIEVTESVLLGEAATKRLRQVKDMGVSIALDDFGTGFASMSYLREFPYSKIKIDRSFVANMGDPNSRAIVNATIHLAKALKIETTAEGVETQEQMDELRRAGASQAQGYFIALPMPGEHVTHFLKPWLTEAA